MIIEINKVYIFKDENLNLLQCRPFLSTSFREFLFTKHQLMDSLDLLSSELLTGITETDIHKLLQNLKDYKSVHGSDNLSKIMN